MLREEQKVVAVARRVRVPELRRRRRCGPLVALALLLGRLRLGVHRVAHVPVVVALRGAVDAVVGPVEVRVVRGPQESAARRGSGRPRAEARERGPRRVAGRHGATGGPAPPDPRARLGPAESGRGRGETPLRRGGVRAEAGPATAVVRPALAAPGPRPCSGPRPPHL